ncbi:ABC transporter substrate-binding protein [Streptobacillus canis]|uniref:ABC transporter substrate-binding protein n=1 Tax=Streptobacillus canis TaxID=2678686 RepID=UPI0012E2D6A5|nr:sugar ABC transporter substrate-binding protein [Streptobacillus canis]
MKKIIILLSMIFMMFSCGTKKESTDATEEKVIKVWTYLSNNEAKVFQTQLDNYSKEKGVKIQAEYIPFGDYKKQLSVAIGAGTLPDIIMIDNPDHAQFAQMGIFADITDKMNAWEGKDMYFKGPMLSTMVDGKHYGLPFTSNNLALFYNKKMLNEAGVEVPTTWVELKEAAKKLTKNGIFGMAVGSPKNEEATFQFLPWMISAGGSYDKLNSEGTIKAASFWRELIVEGLMSKETPTWGQGDAQKQFSAEKVAMFIGGPWMVSQITTDNPNIEFGVAMMPVDKVNASVLGGENLGITSSTKDLDAAWDLLKYIGDYNTVKEFIGQTGYFPPRSDVAKEPEWTTDPIKKVFAEQMQYALPRGPHAKWPEISEAIYTALQEIEVGALTPEEALNNAQMKIEPLLK